MPGFNTAGWQNASDAISQNQPANNGWLDRVLGRVDDGFDVYDRVRCAANPTAPGCYQPNNGRPAAVPPPNNTWLYVGLGFVLLLVIGIVIIALKK